MALEWAAKLKKKIVEMASKKDDAKTTPASTTYTIDAYQPPPAPPTPSWHDAIVDAWPIFMLAAGLIITACTQLIGIWAILGYLLVALSPVVHLLRRIERRLRR